MASHAGGCLCGEVRVVATGDPAANVLCYCVDCRKISGTTYSYNALFSTDSFKVEKGSPKKYAKTADSGQVITSHLCGTCGTTLWRESPGTFPGLLITKAGIYDGDELSQQPIKELFTARRPDWVKPVSAAEQT